MFCTIWLPSSSMTDRYWLGESGCFKTPLARKTKKKFPCIGAYNDGLFQDGTSDLAMDIPGQLTLECSLSETKMTGNILGLIRRLCILCWYTGPIIIRECTHCQKAVGMTAKPLRQLHSIEVNELIKRCDKSHLQPLPRALEICNSCCII